MASLLNMSGGSLLKKGLPYDAEIEYLESSGTQYIDTLIVGRSSLVAQCDACYTVLKFDNNGWIFGGRVSSTQESIFISCDGSKDCFFGVWSNYDHITINEDWYQFHTFEYDCSAYLKIDGTKLKEWEEPKNLYGTRNIWLFNLNSNGSLHSSRTFSGKIKYIKFWDSSNPNIILGNFIPVVDKQGVACMYDEVSKQLFYNQGTGSFIAGPRVS